MALPIHFARTLSRVARHTLAYPSSSSRLPLPHRYRTAGSTHWTRRCLANSAANARPRDYYSVLGLDRDASPADVKKAYYQLAKAHHPDTASGDPNVFAEINQAYEVLSDEKRRRIYDAFGHEGVEASDAGVDPHGAGMGGMGGMGGFGSASAEDLLREFGEFFRGQGAAPRGNVDAPAAGGNKETTVTLDFMEAVRGVDKTVRVSALRACADCEGSGKTSKTRVADCPDCDGQGRVQMRAGMFQAVIATCSKCAGAGKLMRDPCGTCRGQGVTPGIRETAVAFPEGTDTGMVLRVPAAGDDGVRRGPPGDLYIQVHVREHDYFHRDGRNIHVVAPISIAQAALGGTVTVRTIDGEESIRIRPGTQPDDRVTMAGRALRSVSSARRGDQVVHLKVVVPDTLTERQRELLNELLELEGGKINKPDECSSKGLLQRFQRFLRTTIGTDGRGG